MIDLAQYKAAKSQLRPGDLVFYWGSALLSRLIEGLSCNGPSHVQIVESVLADGTVMIAESTIENHVSGVQRHPLTHSIESYPDGSTVGAALLRDDVRARADWSQLSPFVDSCIIGMVGYDVLGLVKFLEPEGLREGQANDVKMVCSSFATAALEHVGVLAGIPYSQSSPQLLIQMRLYASFVPLAGRPRPRHFDSV
jgi:hypothetical protein